MKRVLSLVLALVMVLGMIPTFAAEMTGGEHLLEHGFITGKPGDDVATKLDAGAALTRQELAALIAELMGEKEIAAVFAQPADYADADKIGAWAVPFVAYAQVNGWMSGKPGNMFDPTGPVPGQQLAAVLMNALGYTVDTQAKYATVIADAAVLGLAVPSGNLTRGEAFTAMWTAVSEVKVNGEDVTLGVKLGKLTPPAPVVTDLAVVGVEASNLREVIVSFNNEIDEKTLDKANFLLGTTAATSVELSADGKVVTAWFTMTNQTAYTLNIKTVKDVNGSEVKDFSQAITVNDFAAPVVTKVEVVGNKKIVVTFSEPVDPTYSNILGNYKIDGLLFGGTVTTSGREVTIVTTNRLTDGVHTLVVSNNVVDFAGFKLVANSNEFVVAKDDVKPAVAKIVSASQTKVVLEFTEPVENTFTVTAGVGVLSSKSTTDFVTYTLNFASTYLPLAGTELTLTDVTDYYGNKDTIKVNVVPTIDLTRPELVSAVATAQNKIKVVFTKDIAIDGIDSTTGYTLKTTDATPVTVVLASVEYDKDDEGDDILNTVIITTTSPMAVKSYTLQVLGIEDLSPLKNQVVPTVVTIAVADLTKPTVQSVKITQPDSTTAGALYIEFSEKVDAATAQDKLNYSYIVDAVRPVSLGSSHTVSVLSDGKTVKITLPKIGALESAVTSVTIINVTDTAGNKLTSTVKSGGDLAVYAPSVVAVSNPRAIAPNKVVVDVTTNINPTTVTASDFIFQETGTAANKVYVINAEYDSEEDTITLTLNTNLSKTAETANDTIDLHVIATNLADIYGEKISTGLIATVADEIAPYATKLASAVYAAGTLTMVVELSEDLDGNDVFNAGDFVIVANNKLYVADNAVYADAAGNDAAKLTITVVTADNLLNKALKLNFFTTSNYVDDSANQLLNFEFAATIK